MKTIDAIYDDLSQTILRDGFEYTDKTRNHIGMIQIPNYTIDYNMINGFPLLTSKRVFWKLVAHELIWMLSGSETLDYLHANGVHIWDKDAKAYDPSGNKVGRVYGAQWRSWYVSDKVYMDQIRNLLDNLVHHTFSRRHIVTAWRPDELHQMCLPPCHWSFEVIPFIAEQRTKPYTSFALKWHQRSVDTFLGLPFDIASYAFLGHIIEAETGMRFERLIGDLSNVHFYDPHIPKIKEQLLRPVGLYNPPTFQLTDYRGFDTLTIDSFKIKDYQCHPPIKAEMYPKINK